MVISKLKLFFLAFLWVCLWLTSFSSATLNYTEWTAWIWICYSPVWSPSVVYWMYWNEESLTKWQYDLKLCLGAYDWNVSYQDLRYTYVWLGSMGDMFFNEWGILSWNGCSIIKFIDSNSYSQVWLVSDWSLNNQTLYIDSTNFDSYVNWNTIFKCRNLVLDSSNIGFFDSFTMIDLFEFPLDWQIRALAMKSNTNYNAISWTQSNLNQCLEDKNQLIWQVSTLSWNLTTCQSDLSDCMWWQDASLLACIDQKEQCESSLDTLSWNYASLENMNSSLSSQLQECLESWWSWSSDLICNTFDLFWDSDNTRYSFPINNNLILPPWYKGFVNEWVLVIKQDNNNAYSIDDEDFQKVMDSYWVVFLYLFGWALFLMFLFVIRKYFIWLKS